MSEVKINYDKNDRPVITLVGVEIRFSVNNDGSGLFKTTPDAPKYSSSFMIEKDSDNYKKLVTAIGIIKEKHKGKKLVHQFLVDCDTEEYRGKVREYAEGRASNNTEITEEVINGLVHMDDNKVRITAKNQFPPRYMLRDNKELDNKNVSQDDIQKFTASTKVTVNLTLDFYKYKTTNHILCFLNAVKELGTKFENEYAKVVFSNSNLDDEFYTNPEDDYDGSTVSDDDELDNILNG